MTFSSREWLTRKEVAARLKVHSQTVGGYYRSGRLPGVKLGTADSGRIRHPVEAVEAFIVGDQALLAKIRQELEAAQTRRQVHGPRKPRGGRAAR